MSRTLIVGLGNPGAQYARTRHNIGFMVIDRLAQRIGVSVTSTKFKGFWAGGQLAGGAVTLLKPQTYMNLSGASVQPAMAFYGVGLEDVIVVHDELDLEAGVLRLKQDGGHGGHNGLRDIIAKCGGKAFFRVRCGVGRPAHGSAADWVLSAFGADQEALRDQMVEQACDAIETLLKEGLAQAQNRFHA